MFEGELLAIFVTPTTEGAMQSVAQAEAVVGQGLDGDRYAAGEGTFAKPGEADREITLIESEAIDAACQEYKIEIEPIASRRNLLTRNVPLNHLVGRTFQVGDATLRGIRLCEPCNHLEELTIPDVRKALVHRGGLRAQVVGSGVVKPGDVIRLAGEH